MKHILFVLFLISSIYSQEYNRKYFKHWVDFDKDCQDARVEVLIHEHLPQFGNIVYSEDSCKVISGLWYDHFSGQYIDSTSKLDVDHVVPLKNAWISGAYKWSKEKKEMYANYMEDENHLMAVSYRENRSKGAKAPHEWMPSNKNFHVIYCKVWVSIKVKWDLTVSKEEFDFLKDVLKDEKENFLDLLKVRD